PGVDQTQPALGIVVIVCDRELDVVIADGQLERSAIEDSRNHTGELCWACCGGTYCDGAVRGHARPGRSPYPSRVRWVVGHPHQRRRGERAHFAQLKPRVCVCILNKPLEAVMNLERTEEEEQAGEHQAGEGHEVES